MADKTRKEYEIHIGGLKESVDGTKTLNDALGEQKKQFSSTTEAMEHYYKVTGEAAKKQEEFARLEEQAAKKAIKNQYDLDAARKTVNDNLQKYMDGATMSYNEQQQLLTALGKVIKNTTGDTSQLVEQYKKLNDQLKATDETMGNHQRNVGDYRGALKEASSELKNLKGEMMGLEQGSDEFNKLAKEAGALQDKIGDINAAIKRQASDTKHLDDVINLAQSATAAFELYKGAMSAFGFETEEAEKAMQKLVGAMSIIQSLQTLSETLQSTTATGQLFHKMLQMVGLEAKTVAVAEDTAAASTTAMAAAENTATVATKGLNVGLKALRIALASIGIGLVIMLVAALVEHWEELVGWFQKTFPALSKLSGWFNKVRGTISGLVDAVWAAIKSFGSLGDMIKAIFSGEWGKVVDIAKQNIANITNAFQTGYADKMAEIEEEVTAKNAAESNKRTKQELEELKIQERNNKTYSKKYIDLQKKDFAERKKMAKGNQEELNKIKLEEMKFYADVEDKKTAAAKAGASERAKAAKEAAKEAAEAAKAEAEQEKKLLNARRAFRDEYINNEILELKQYERTRSLRLEGYDSGPLEKYNEELEKLNEILHKIDIKEAKLQLAQIGDYLQDNITMVEKTSAEWQKYIVEVKSAKDIDLKFTEEQKKALISQGKTVKEIASLEKEELNKILTEWQKIEGIRLKSQDESNAKIIDNDKKALSVMKNEISDYADDFERKYKRLLEVVKDSPLENVERNSFWGTVQTGKTLENLEILKTNWVKAEVALSDVVRKMEQRWDEYLQMIVDIYGKDSSAYKKALKERYDAFVNYNNKMTEVKDRSQTQTSTEIDYTGDNQPSGSTKSKRTLWDKDSDFLKNMSNLFDSLDEMVLAPAMDTFAMFMDFAIEETQQRLEEVEKMHDDALDKIEESADKIQELNDKLKDSSNTNIEVTKQQLADEQILYAQRLAEERKLADEEKNLKNKAAQQEANARKMELRYQMVMSVANTAQGVSKTLAEWPYPLSAIFAALQGALGAVQTALIAKQIGTIKPVKYSEGGILQGKSHAQGGIKVGNTGIEVEGGEAIISKRATSKYWPILDAINASENGGKHTIANSKKQIMKYADGGTLNFGAVDEKLRSNISTNRIIDAISDINFQPVVAVKDIWKVEDRLVKVRSLAGK